MQVGGEELHYQNFSHYEVVERQTALLFFIEKEINQHFYNSMPSNTTENQN